MNATPIPKSGGAISSRGANAEELLLLERIRQTDDGAYEVLYRLYNPRLTNFLLNLVRRPQRVEESLNDTMLAEPPANDGRP